MLACFLALLSALVLDMHRRCRDTSPTRHSALLSCLQKHAHKVQRRLINKPRHPAQVAADVVEQVLRTGAERYLETMQHKLTWWQLSLLDVKLFLAALALVIMGFLVFIAITVMKFGMYCFRMVQAGSHSHKKAE